MAWEDPLKLGRNKKRCSIKDEFKSEVHPFAQDVILSDYFSNLALALIGEGDKIDYSATQSISGGYYEEVGFFSELENISNGFDTPFISLLDLCFDSETKKYDVLLRHFQLFKEANIMPILGTLMKDDNNLYLLTTGAFELKLAEDLSFREALNRKTYRFEILNYLGAAISKEVDDVEEYAEDIMSAFCESAMKLNPDILFSQDCNCLKKHLFVDALMKVLLKHIQWLKLGYFQIMYGDERNEHSTSN